ncbi:MAG: ABC transporter ATP-binding protein [Hyphomicrobiales bacterium]|nr:ABC transporter ATP-binding protein [Hyphomicrobiales bacterium]
MLMLEARNLTAFYEDFQALFGLDMTVLENQVIAVIGANGAGKTTSMRAITGLLPSSPGMVRWKGQDIGHLRADQIAALGIAMVPEGRQLFASLNVEENLIIGGRSGRSGVWNLSRVYELFPVLGERRHQAAASLSGGQQQMAAIGRALMSNPELILFDEISLGLAPIIIKQIYQVLPDIIGGGISAIVVEQDISKALAVADRVYCLSEGRIALEGETGSITREEIFHAYFGV